MDEYGKTLAANFLTPATIVGESFWGGVCVESSKCGSGTHVSIVRCSSSISEMIISEIMEIRGNPKMGFQNGYPKWVTYVTHLCN